ncbi:hypothetical protein [Pseudomonas brassicacearum]|uniref:hypothetical protein n=1 Tax=Pseudomonas brassicacearum TaxID=930166 RepID=UPI00162147C5|nr:hypothetical protein [Pseudomonas brassicacearum]
MHWLESDGCCDAVVIENLVFVVVGRSARNGQGAIFTEAGSPSWSRPAAGYYAETFMHYSDSKKYRQEMLMSKVESEPSVIFKLLVS